MLGNAKGLFKDSFVYGASSVLSQVISLFLVPFYTKELAPEDYGVFAMSIVLTSFLVPIGALGMDGALFRYYSMTDSREAQLGFVSSATVLKTSSMLVLLAVLIPLFSLINHQLFEGRLTQFQYYLILATFAIESFSLLTISVLRSERKVLRIARNNIITLLVSVVISLWLVIFLKMKVEGVLLANLLSAVVKALFYLNDSVKMFSLKLVNTQSMKTLLGYGLPVIPHKLQAQVIVLFTTFIINHRLGIAVAGLYAVSQKMSKPFTFVVSMVQQSWAPYKFQMHKTEKNPAKAFRDLISLYWIMLLFLWAALSMATPPLFKLLIHPKYWDGIPYVPFIMFVSLCQGFYFTLTTGFELSSKQYKMIKASFLGLVSMVAASLLTSNLLPPFSFILCQSLAFLVMGFVLLPEARKHLQIEYPIIPSLVLLVFSACCVGIGYHTHVLLTNIGLLFLLFIGFGIASKFILPPGYCEKGIAILWKKYDRKKLLDNE